MAEYGDIKKAETNFDGILTLCLKKKKRERDFPSIELEFRPFMENLA